MKCLRCGHDDHTLTLRPCGVVTTLPSGAPWICQCLILPHTNHERNTTMNKRYITIPLAFAVGVVLALVLGLRPANAAPPSPGLYSNCIDKAEYYSLKPGTVSETEARVDAHGPVVYVGSNGTVMVRQYHYCGYGVSAINVQIAYGLTRRGEWVALTAVLFDYRGYPFAHHPIDGYPA